jgi:hypothetical protein
MWGAFIFGMHWRHGGKMYYDELSVGSQDEAARICLADGCMMMPRAAEKQKKDGGKCAGFYKQVNPAGFFSS